VLRKVSIAYGNVEGTVAEGIGYDGREVQDPGRRLDRKVYDAPPLCLSFNYHRSLIDDLKVGGFSVLSTANNHALDRGSLGVDRTVQAFDAAGLAFTGTRKRGEASRPWSVVTRAHGFTIAWLACTYGTNGIADTHGQVLRCFEQQDLVLAETRRLNASGVDAIIIVPHWGIEGHRVVERRQRDLARAMFAAGALAVIGTHPHVLQEWEFLNAEARGGLVVYSTGNFVSAQPGAAERQGLSLVELARGTGGKARIARVGYILTQIRTRPEFRVIASNARRVPRQLPRANRVLDVDSWLSTCP
jgi:poly-gamma-glutamate synthesis protein (capsule biosynthesis protein)